MTAERSAVVASAAGGSSVVVFVGPGPSPSLLAGVHQATTVQHCSSEQARRGVK